MPPRHRRVAGGSGRPRWQARHIRRGRARSAHAGGASLLPPSLPSTGWVPRRSGALRTAHEFLMKHFRDARVTPAPPAGPTFMTTTSTVLPGQRTLLACWEALTRLSSGARIVQTPGALAAVFPSWDPLNNAILRGGHDASSETVEAADLRALYEEAGVPVWALWRATATRDLDTPDMAGALGELKRDTTTLVMHTTLAPSLPGQESVVAASID